MLTRKMVRVMKPFDGCIVVFALVTFILVFAFVRNPFVLYMFGVMLLVLIVLAIKELSNK